MTDDAGPFSPATLGKIEEVRSLADSLFGEFEELFWMAVEDMYPGILKERRDASAEDKSKARGDTAVLAHDELKERMLEIREDEKTLDLGMVPELFEVLADVAMEEMAFIDDYIRSSKGVDDASITTEVWSLQF